MQWKTDRDVVVARQQPPNRGEDLPCDEEQSKAAAQVKFAVVAFAAPAERREEDHGEEARDNGDQVLGGEGLDGE